jgi:hypothetical protein
MKHIVSKLDFWRLARQKRMLRDLLMEFRDKTNF